jgi:hypothetical protein
MKWLFWILALCYVPIPLYFFHKALTTPYTAALIPGSIWTGVVVIFVFIGILASKK